MRIASRFIKAKKSLYFAAAIFVVSTVLLFAFSNKFAQAAVTVDTSTSSVATYGSHARKTWYDGTRHWAAFQTGGSTIEFWYSTNGTSWTQNSSATLSSDSVYFSVEADSSNAYIVYSTGDLNVYARKASSYPGAGFSWGSQNTVVNSGSELIKQPTITRGTDGKLCIGYIQSQDVNPFDTYVRAIISTNADDVTSWGSATTLESDTSPTGKDWPVVVPLAGGDLYAAWAKGDIIGKKYTSGSGWAGSQTIIANDNLPGSMISLTSSTTADKVFLAYSVGTSDVTFRDYDDSTGMWSSAVTLDTSGSNEPPVLSIDKSNSDALYVLWIDDSNGTIYYKKGVSPYASANWDSSRTSFYSGSNINYVSSSFRDGGAKINYIWVEGSASPYNIRSQSIDLQGPPSAPTLSSPSSGATGVTLSPQFQFSATDSNADYIRYRLYLYESNCSTAVGSSPFTQPDGTPQTGWSGQDSQSSTAYASGSTATYAYQGTLNLNTTYCWKVDARDPGGTNTYGTASSTRLFTTMAAPATPTLIQPASSQTAIPLRPQFQLRTTDTDNDYLQYHIKVYSTQTECNNDSATNLVRSIDQSSSQAGWAGQDQQSATAYTGKSSINDSRIAAHNYQSPALAANTAYWWKARAIDPGGSNTWSSWATCITFTTASTDVRIQGGVNIRGGSRIQ